MSAIASVMHTASTSSGSSRTTVCARRRAGSSPFPRTGSWRTTHTAVRRVRCQLDPRPGRWDSERVCPYEPQPANRGASGWPPMTSSPPARSAAGDLQRHPPHLLRRQLPTTTPTIVDYQKLLGVGAAPPPKIGSKTARPLSRTQTQTAPNLARPASCHPHDRLARTARRELPDGRRAHQVERIHRDRGKQLFTMRGVPAPPAPPARWQAGRVSGCRLCRWRTSASGGSLRSKTGLTSSSPRTARAVRSSCISPSAPNV